MPLSKVGVLVGTAGALNTRSGVLVSRDDGLALYTHDLGRQHWHHATTTRKELVRWKDSVLMGPIDGNILEIDVSTGGVLRRVPCTIEGRVRATDGNAVVVAGARQVACISAVDGQLLWKHDWLLPYVACAGGRVFVRRDLSDDLACVDTETGVCHWVFRAAAEGSDATDDRSHVIFDFGVLPDYVVVVTRNGRVYKLDLVTGQPIAVGRPEILGLPLVTGRSVFFKRPDGLLEYSHSTLQEVSRLEYGRELRKIWTDPLPAVNAFCVTTESVIWTTMAGVMFGVQRIASDDARRCWLDDLDGALMPAYQPPFVGDEYLYFEPKRSAAGLVCYRPAG